MTAVGRHALVGSNPTPGAIQFWLVECEGVFCYDTPWGVEKKITRKEKLTEKRKVTIRTKTRRSSNRSF